jgi:predicted nucleic acid-binding protein
LAEIICNTSPLQYLHQLGLLHLLPALVEKIIVPPAVLAEIEIGRENTVDLPDLSTLDWIEIRQAKSSSVLSLTVDLGIGETEVLALALESKDAVVILDDLLARQAAEKLDFKIIETLGILLEAKRKELISEISPVLDKLQELRFRVSLKTKQAALKLAGEEL